MRLHRFYVKIPITLERFDISDRDLIHQWRTVFRYNVGSQVILFDGGGTDHLCMITSLRNLGATVEVIEKKTILNLRWRKPQNLVSRILFLCFVNEAKRKI